jgi:hypothetical protein
LRSPANQGGTSRWLTGWNGDADPLAQAIGSYVGLVAVRPGSGNTQILLTATRWLVSSVERAAMPGGNNQRASGSLWTRKSSDRLNRVVVQIV